MKPFFHIHYVVIGLTCTPLSGLANVKDLGTNLISTLNFKIEAYPSKPGNSIVPDQIIEDAPITSVVRYDWVTWFETAGNVRIDTTGWLEFGVPNTYRWSGGVSLFQDDEMKSKPLVINEIYATKPMGNLDLLFGRSIQRNTVSLLYPLADRYVARDFNDPINPKILGLWQARADYYIQSWQLSLAALPIFQPSKLPNIESRWFIRNVEPIIGQSIPAGATGSLERDIPSVNIENTSVLASLKTHQSQWDAFTTVYHGYSPHSVTRVTQPTPNEYVLTFEYVPGFEWSGGASTVFGPLELHTEALYHHSYSGKDDDYINGLIGMVWRTDQLAKWLNCNQVHLIAEYVREHLIKEQEISSGFISSSEPFRLGKNSLHTECLLEITSRNHAAISYSHNIEENNAFMQLRGGHRFLNGVHLEIVVDLFAGTGLYYGTWNSNDRVYFNYKYSF